MDAIHDLCRAGLPPECEAVVLTVADVVPSLLDTSGDDGPGLSPQLRGALRHVHGHARRAMDDAREFSRSGQQRVRALFPTWAVTAEAIADSPHWAIARRADELHADLVVVGSHGRSAIGRAVMGSVSQRVLRHAPCSVRVCRRPVEGKREKAGSVKVLLGLDGSRDSAAAVEALAARRWPSGSEALVVTAVDLRVLLCMIAAGELPPTPPGTAEARPDEPDDVYHGLRRLQHRVAADLRAAGLEPACVLREGEPKRMLVDEAKRWDADCIVLGARGLGRLERVLMGSVAESVAARAHCSVEVIRP